MKFFFYWDVIMSQCSCWCYFISQSFWLHARTWISKWFIWCSLISFYNRIVNIFFLQFCPLSNLTNNMNIFWLWCHNVSNLHASGDVILGFSIHWYYVHMYNIIAIYSPLAVHKIMCNINLSFYYYYNYYYSTGLRLVFHNCCIIATRKCWKISFLVNTAKNISNREWINGSIATNVKLFN